MNCYLLSLALLMEFLAQNQRTVPIPRRATHLHEATLPRVFGRQRWSRLLPGRRGGGCRFSAEAAGQS
jgi:hypothetical protein